MKRVLMTTAICAVILIGANAQAGDTKYFWHDDQPQAWRLDSTTGADNCWYEEVTHVTPTTKAGTGDYAVILADCYLDQDETCGNFQVTNGINLYVDDVALGSVGHTLTVDSDDTSYVHTNAVVYLRDDTSVLQFSDDHTLDGAGRVRGDDDSATISIDSTKTLINSTTIEGHLQITGDGSFTNQDIVNANDSGTLKLAVAGTLDDNSDAYWKATAVSAILNFDSAIGTLNSLEGEFIIENSPSAEIEVNETLLTTGRLYMTNGVLDVNETTTMGNAANHMSVTIGVIDVASGKTFTHN